MFHFIDFSSTIHTLSQNQGKLFERLLKDIVNACGYKDIELRAKMSSMEYDVSAKGKLDNVPLVGEAKAHTPAKPCFPLLAKDNLGGTISMPYGSNDILGTAVFFGPDRTQISQLDSYESNC